MQSFDTSTHFYTYTHHRGPVKYMCPSVNTVALERPSSLGVFPTCTVHTLDCVQIDMNTRVCTPLTHTPSLGWWDEVVGSMMRTPSSDQRSWEPVETGDSGVEREIPLLLIDTLSRTIHKYEHMYTC